MLEDLPKEVLSQVLDNLPWRDRLSCSKVSKKWFRAANTEDFRNSTLIRLPKIEDIVYAKRNYKHISIFSEIGAFPWDESSINAYVLDIFKRRGRHVLTLQMGVGTLNTPGLKELFASLSKLQQLILSEGQQSSAKPTPLPLASLQKLTFYANTNLDRVGDFPTFCGYFSENPQLKSVHLYNFSYAQSLDALVVFLKRHQFITDLRLPACLDDAGCILVWNAVSPQLRGLHLNELQYEGFRGDIPAVNMIEIMCSRFTNLRHLDLSRITHDLEGNIYGPIFQSQLVKLKNLTHLKLDDSVTMDYALSLLPVIGHNLVSLCIIFHNCRKICLEILENLGMVFKNLNHLELLYSLSPDCPDVNLNAILQHFPNLTKLKLYLRYSNRSSATADEVLLGIVNKCPGLIDLYFDFVIRKEATQLCILNKLVNLRVLNLGTSPRNSYHNLALAALQRLNAPGSDLIDFAEVLVRNCPKLRFIFCDALTDTIIGDCVVASRLFETCKWKESPFFPN